MKVSEVLENEAVFRWCIANGVSKQGELVEAVRNPLLSPNGRVLGGKGYRDGTSKGVSD